MKPACYIADSPTRSAAGVAVVRELTDLCYHSRK